MDSGHSDGLDGMADSGFEFGPGELSFDADRVTEYAELSGDHNPIHLDQDYARAQGLAGPIVHGMLLLSGVCGIAQGWAGSNARLVSVSCRFHRPLLVGGRLMVYGRVIARSSTSIDIGIEAVSDADEKVLTRSQAAFRISSNGQP